MTITASDIALDPKVGTALVEITAPTLAAILRENPGPLGIYIMFVGFASACKGAAQEPYIEFLELLDIYEGVPPAASGAFRYTQ